MPGLAASRAPQGFAATSAKTYPFSLHRSKQGIPVSIAPSVVFQRLNGPGNDKLSAFPSFFCLCPLLPGVEQCPCYIDLHKWGRMRGGGGGGEGLLTRRVRVLQNFLVGGASRRIALERRRRFIDEEEE